jgi:hypothetical protein
MKISPTEEEKEKETLMGMIPLAKDFYWHSSVKLWQKVDSILVNISGNNSKHFFNKVARCFQQLH